MKDYQLDVQERIEFGIDQLKELTQCEIELLEGENLEEAQIVEEYIVELCVELDVLILIRSALFGVQF